MNKSQEGAASGPQSLPRRIGLKYCGGCAPRYDRVAQVKAIERELHDLVTLLSPDAERLEAVLIVAGCPTCCVETRDFCPLPVLRIRSETDARRFIDDIRSEPSRDLAGSTLSVVG
ncbi:hypothetical protein [Desulfoluna spongiiphila]|uniref:Uncharacterized protein n=1 Tax=Desulfoluna spongiiphila TaxID=419481 RepID=A0A1G5HQ40_9BACT|nr:hypothetical protein [Desulfoluna spongiiphila]SCY65539.1 hypothetical protein SAMN05216233_11531 [Desulfoluna spongiiphila]VVS95692.1 hypothetical protein DBB_52690 [Desulfoluna spongiiphila]